jgi:DNA-binding protein HU-beta
MNKADLVTRISRAAGITKPQADKVLHTLIESVRETLRRGERVTLVGFGTFAVMSRAARKGRNPQTGREIFIPVSRIAKFKPGKLLRQAASGSSEAEGTELLLTLLEVEEPRGSGRESPSQSAEAEGPHGSGPGF